MHNQINRENICMSHVGSDAVFSKLVVQKLLSMRQNYSSYYIRFLTIPLVGQILKMIY